LLLTNHYSCNDATDDDRCYDNRASNHDNHFRRYPKSSDYYFTASAIL